MAEPCASAAGRAKLVLYGYHRHSFALRPSWVTRAWCSTCWTRTPTPNADPDTGRSEKGDTGTLMAASRKGRARGRGASAAWPWRRRQPTPASGAAALIIASRDGHVEMARLLLAHNTDPGTATADGGLTAGLLRCSRHPQVATWRWHGCSLHTAPTPMQQRRPVG